MAKRSPSAKNPCARGAEPIDREDECDRSEVLLIRGQNRDRILLQVQRIIQVSQSVTTLEAPAFMMVGGT